MTTTADEVTKLEPRKEEGNNSVKRREGWPKLEWRKKNHPGLIRHSSSLFAVLLFFQISNFSLNIYFPAYFVQETIFNRRKFGERGNLKMGGGGHITGLPESAGHQRLWTKKVKEQAATAHCAGSQITTFLFCNLLCCPRAAWCKYLIFLPVLSTSNLRPFAMYW